MPARAFYHTISGGFDGSAIFPLSFQSSFPFSLRATLIDLVIALAHGHVFDRRHAAGGGFVAGEVANRVKCATNLRQIGQAFQFYANENNGNFPRTKYDHAATKVNAYTGFTAADPFAKDAGPEANDVTAILYLLLRTQDLETQVFVCPSTDAQPLNFGISLRLPPLPRPPPPRAGGRPPFPSRPNCSIKSNSIPTSPTIAA